MAAEDKKFISKINPGFPDYLDWEKLRSAGIDYLGKLSGKIWTDHNVHDPGITILEILCYAITDLGYRTNLPIADVLARNPDETTKDNNFFSAADILTCNPLSITDIRKMLVDIEGVKNAWVEATDYDCYQGAPYLHFNDPDYLNGLYKVHIETEETYDDSSPSDKKAADLLLTEIRNALMQHRNLCEDVTSISILCKKKIGLCADIELEDDADAATVYTGMIDKLREFFSPAPKFYTLKQLVEEKNRAIEDVFAGRPYNVQQSFGFVDTEEFENLQLKKEIHLSDVYHIIFDVPGVRNVKNLGWRKNCDQKPVADTSWIWQIPENHIPDFVPSCSVIKFSRHNIAVALDTDKFNPLFDIDFRHNGKVLYKSDSPYLNNEMPAAMYRGDLGDYQSVQNEFPRVYGIAAGGLQADVTDERRAKAYQLKAYLLFYDQLLANYAAQLKNLRGLFSLSGEADKKNRHTYFLNQLSDAADMAKLLRFKADGETSGFLGTDGTTLAVPVSRQWLDKLLETGDFKELCEAPDLYPYEFCNETDCTVAMSIVREDLFNGSYTAGVLANKNDCYWFYFFTSSTQIAFFSQHHYTDATAAARAAAAVQFTGSFKDNFRSFENKNLTVSFFIELRMSGYTDYLQRLVEDEPAYYKRRGQFLDHLLSRFAERFTDFALLSFSSINEKKLLAATIKNKEHFLTHYDDLSSNRGRAFDYFNNKNTNNLSGFEKRAGALMGFENDKRNALCNFVVEKYEEHYIISIKFAGSPVLFTSPEKFYSQTAAEDAVKALLEALQHDTSYGECEDKNLLSFRLKINYGNSHIFFSNNYNNPEALKKLHQGVYNLFSDTPVQKRDVYVSKEVYQLILRDYNGNEIATSVENFGMDAEDKAKEYAQQAADFLTDAAKWKYNPGETAFEKIVFDNSNPDALRFINKAGFRTDINDTIVGRPNKFEYDLLDQGNNFKFSSVNEYNSHEEAGDSCWKLLIPLANRSAYKPYNDDQSVKFSIEIRQNDSALARTAPRYTSTAAAATESNRIYQLIVPHVYSITIEKRPNRWNFSYLLGYLPEEQLFFKSQESFEDPAVAFENAQQFYALIKDTELSPYENNKPLKLVNAHSTCVYENADGINPDHEHWDKAHTLLQIKKK